MTSAMMSVVLTPPAEHKATEVDTLSRTMRMPQRPAGAVGSAVQACEREQT